MPPVYPPFNIWTMELGVSVVALEITSMLYLISYNQ
jgi:hypothetical protein